MARVDQNPLVKNARGAVGKDGVYKIVNGKTLLTKYPDRSGVNLTISQESCQNIFKKAVAYAKSIMADETLKRDWEKMIRNNKSTRGTTVYHAAIQQYMKQNSPKAREKEVKSLLEKWQAAYPLSARQVRGLDFFLRYGKLNHSIYRELNKVSKPTATRDLQELVAMGLLAFSGKGAGTCYSFQKVPGETGETVPLTHNSAADGVE